MATVTSLLRSAAAARKKVQAQRDAEMAFMWESSAQTYADFLEYSRYLEDAQRNAPADDALTYASKMRAARRSYVSNELQRKQIDIMEGRAGTQDKMNLIKDLYFQAVENGDFNLAQNLYSQYDALSIKLQNEIEAGVRGFGSGARGGGSGTNAYEDLAKDITKGFEDITLPNGQKVTPLPALEENFRDTGDIVGVMQAADETLDALRSVIIDQYNTATTQDEIDKLEEKYGPGLRNIDREIYVTVGGKKLDYQKVVNAIANDQFNNPIFNLKAVRNEATGKNEFQLQENQVDRIDYARQFDPTTGEEYFAPLTVRTDQEKLMFGSSDQGRGLGTQITDEGEVIGAGFEQAGKTVGNINAGEKQIERNEAFTIENRLKNLGIIAKTNGTTLTIKLPGESVERMATIQPDGSIRYFDDEGQMLEIGIVDRNLGSDMAPLIARAGQIRAVSPEEISDFGSRSAFGGMLSQASLQGRRYLDDITGRSPVASIMGNLRGPIRTGNDFSGLGGAVTSQLLQSAGMTRQEIQIQAEKQRMLQAEQEAAARLQATPTFNLNQVPVQQLTSSGILRRQLQVAAPAPTPRLYVAPPPPTPTISSVSVAQPTQRITSVGVAPYSGRVTVR